MLLMILALACVAGAVFLVGEVVTLPVREREGSIRRAASYGKPQRPQNPADVESLSVRALQPAKEKVARTVLRLSPKANYDSVAFKLLSAGLSRRISPTGFLAAKGLFAIAGVAFGAAFGGVSGATSAILIAAALGAFGFILPDFVVNAGGVICAAVEYHGGTETTAFTTIEEKIRQNTEEFTEKFTASVKTEN